MLFNSNGTIIKYNYILEAFYKRKLRYDYTGNSLIEYSCLFENTDNIMEFYIGKRTTDDDFTLKILDYEEKNTYTDDLLYYNSKAELVKVDFGTPTNNKKFKKVVIKGKNDGSASIPMYVSVIVGDIKVLSPENYYIRIDEDENHIYYEKTVNPNDSLDLKTGAVIGEIVLGETNLGAIKSQVFTTEISNKGKTISVIIEDNYETLDANGNPVVNGTNDKPFSISDIGFEFKLKKPKED
jgi:hypothetical protein